MYNLDFLTREKKKKISWWIWENKKDGNLLSSFLIDISVWCLYQEQKQWMVAVAI